MTKDEVVAIIEIMEDAGTRVRQVTSLNVRTRISLQVAQSAFHSAFLKIGDEPPVAKVTRFNEVYAAESKEHGLLDTNALLVAFKSAFDSIDGSDDPMYQ